MNSWILIVVSIVVLLFLGRLIRSNLSQPSADLAYEAKSTLLTKAERSFYGVLSQALDSTKYSIFAQVRMADILEPAKTGSRSHWQKAFNQISSKHCDFVICDADTTNIRLIIELDDSSHKKAKRVSRDDFINEAFKQAGLPLMRVPASRAYILNDLRIELLSMLDPQINLKHADEPAELNKGSALEVPPEIEQSPECPKCGGVMVIRAVSKGNNAGSKFWGCAAFPKCRGIVSNVPQLNFLESNNVEPM